MRTLDARRVLSADRRGSSWPVLIDTDDGLRFTKLRGAAQGTGPLVAEVIVAELAAVLGLRVPSRSLVRITENVPSLDGNDELADLLRASHGVNLGFAYLSGAHAPTPTEIAIIDPDVAAAIRWLDGLVMNADRTIRNPNLLRWEGQLWLIDHGAALGFQYSWADVDEEWPRRPSTAREPHLLHSCAPDLSRWDDGFAARLSRDVLEHAVAEVPDAFLEPMLDGHAAALSMAGRREALRRRRAAYAAFLWKRLKPPRPFLVSVAAPAPRRGRPQWLRGAG